MLECKWPVKSLIYYMKILKPKCFCSSESQGLLFGSLVEFSWYCYSLNSTNSDGSSHRPVWCCCLGLRGSALEGFLVQHWAGITAVLCCLFAERQEAPLRLGPLFRVPPTLVLCTRCFSFSLSPGCQPRLTQSGQLTPCDEQPGVWQSAHGLPLSMLICALLESSFL